MPKSRNRKIKKKNKIKVYPNSKKDFEMEQKILCERWINIIMFASMLTAATWLMYSIKCKHDDEKVIPVSEIKAARQKIQNENIANFMDRFCQNTQ